MVGAAEHRLDSVTGLELVNAQRAAHPLGR